MGAALDLGRQALLTALVISGPILVAGMIVGLIVSLLQTVTQLHDQTLSIVPKIVAMFAAGLYFVPWLVHHLLEYTRAMFAGWG